MKLLTTGLIMLIAITTTIAQHTEFGVKLGANAANFTNDQGSDYRMKTGIHLGVLAHIHLSKTFALQPELMYSGQGTKFAVLDDDFRYHLGYLNLPVLMQLMTESGFRFETGPQIGFLLNASAKSGNASDDIKSSFKKTDFSWVFGVGYITRSKFGFDVRYNAGIADITTAASSNVRNSVIQAGIFYQFK